MAMRRRISLALWVSLMVLPAAVGAAEPITVYKSPYCGCCEGWIDYMRTKGYEPKVVSEEDMGPIKQQYGVPDNLQSCHTAEIGGYVVEGHVPAEAIAKLLADKPKVTGITAPGMPQGSPGMSGEKEHFQVYSFGPRGVAPFMSF